MRPGLPFIVFLAIMVEFLASPLLAVEPTVLDFDELKADDVVGKLVGIYASNTYHKQGVVLSTALCRGQPLVGKQIIVRQTYAGFEVIGGHGQPAISPPNFVIPVGGGPQGCVLMKFSAPVVRVRVTTDRYRDETRDMVRLYALQPEQALQRFSVLAVTEGADDALTEPENQLQVQAATPFQYALFQCTTEREGFDDLEIEWAPGEPAVKTER